MENKLDDLEEEIQKDKLIDGKANRVEEYFKVKQVLRTLRNTLRDLKMQHPEYKELEKINKKRKELVERIKSVNDIHQIIEKIKTKVERQSLIKELIRVELLDTGKQEIKLHGRKLKVDTVLKEIKDKEKKRKSFKNSKYPQMSIFR